MIRDCSSFQCLEGEYVRFCIQMPEENQRLLDLLQTI
jgi:threonine-phosphate decarboxylase